MKRCIILSVNLFLLLITTTYSSEPLYIHYDSLAVISVGGPATVPVLTVIKTKEQLTSYCSDLRYNADSLRSIPDFSEKMILGFRNMAGGGDRANYMKPIDILDGDTLVLEYKPDSTIYPGMQIAAAFSIFLISIPKTEKPVNYRKIQVSATGRFRHQFIINVGKRKESSYRYTLQGQCVPLRNIVTGLIVSEQDRTTLYLQKKRYADK